MNKCGHILLASPAAVRACFAMRRFLRENGLSIVTLGLFFLTFIAGQTFWLSGIQQRSGGTWIGACGHGAISRQRTFPRGDGAKRLRGAFALSVDANQFRAAREAKLLTQYSRLHQAGRARVLATAFTMTITRPQQRTFDLESNTAAKTASSDDSAHLREVKPSVRRSATEHIVEEAH